MSIRPTRREDRQEIENILLSTGAFDEEEVGTALELFDSRFEDQDEDYEFYSSASETGALNGYVCVGPIPFTAGTWDLYWIAVTSGAQGRGVGKELLDYVERKIQSTGGRLIVIETSSTESYAKARRFYTRNGYREFATIRDYYKLGDDLFIYGKYLTTKRR